MEVEYSDGSIGGPPTPEHPWIIEVQVFGETGWSGNNISFRTKEDAEKWGQNLLMRWMGARDVRAVNGLEDVDGK